ncbi:putative regulatory protein [Streptomyces albus]|uniref:Putative regulatory protein n=1 Tax=Streptomyces albus (strain ATCC 21838 / DSM 41398 / FERM P-419 / JCM 4703 / NBRC 107858) TaxID=1081613 RepID=A0A0B5EPR0_STRA4|nr:putative regulatory protein [Streptomyces albus]AOU77892.1 putative regulatory protein [Streptomyces albus]
MRVATAAWDLKNLSESCAVVVTELVANAVQHAQGNDIRVVVERVKPRTVCVSVSDSSPVSPVLRSPSESVEGGRGLILVSALAKDWGTKQLPGGKEVWATVQ